VGSRDEYVISTSGDRALKAWGLETGRELRALEGQSDHVFGVAGSRDGRRVVSASSDHTLKVWWKWGQLWLRSLVMLTNGVARSLVCTALFLSTQLAGYTSWN
jgi:WD domain, G-beta repeat